MTTYAIFLILAIIIMRKICGCRNHGSCSALLADDGMGYGSTRRRDVDASDGLAEEEQKKRAAVFHARTHTYIHTPKQVR